MGSQAAKGLTHSQNKRKEKKTRQNRDSVPRLTRPRARGARAPAAYTRRKLQISASASQYRTDARAARAPTLPVMRLKHGCTPAGGGATDKSEAHREKRPKQMDVIEYSQGLYNMVRAAAAHVLAAVTPQHSG